MGPAPFDLTGSEPDYIRPSSKIKNFPPEETALGGQTVKILLNLLNLATFIFFIIALVTGIHLEKEMRGLGSHLGWILGTLLIWMFTTILSMMYMYRMEKFCVEIVEKYEWKEKEELGG
jgi:hypothetical protein